MKPLPLVFVIPCCVPMEKKGTTILVFILAKLTTGLVLLSLLLPQASSLSFFSPVDNYLINCGSSAPTTLDLNNRRFKGDDSSGSVSLSATRSVSVCDDNPSRDLTLNPIYNSARIFTRPSNYVFPIRDRGAHLVRLHFHWFNSTKFDLLDAQFHVSAGGFLLLNNFSGEKSVIKEYIVPVESDVLVISFIPAKGSKLGFVNAIEVISAPKDLILDLARFVDSNGAVKFSGFSKNALESVYRVNVGGPKITPFNDSLWRTWIPDDGFLESSDDVERVHFSGRIGYQSGGPSRQVAPDSVYNTARVIKSKYSGLPKTKIILSFPVVKGYRYLVRAHFCDIASITSGMLVFNVYLNGYLAEENVEPVLATPFYADLVVDGSSGVVSVIVGPSKWSTPREVDGILNGVEVMKLNNSMGSLDGERSAESVMETSVGVLFPVVAVVCLLVAASVLLQRRVFGGRNGFSWSPIPVDVSEIKSVAM